MSLTGGAKPALKAPAGALKFKSKNLNAVTKAPVPVKSAARESMLCAALAKQRWGLHHNPLCLARFWRGLVTQIPLSFFLRQGMAPAVDFCLLAKLTAVPRPASTRQKALRCVARSTFTAYVLCA